MLKEKLIEHKDRASPKKRAAKLAVSKISKVKASLKQSTGVQSDEGELQHELEQKQRQQQILTAHGVVAAGVVVISIAAATLEPFKLVCVAMLFPIVLAPYVVFQRHRINQIGTFRKALHEVRGEVNRMDSENAILTGERTKLEDAVSRLSATEMRLQSIVEQQGTDVNRVRELVIENRAIQTELNKSLQNRVLQDVIRTILASDQGRDFHFDEHEIDQLVLRMKNVHGLKFNDESFRRSISSKKVTSSGGKRESTSVSAVVEISKAILSNSLPKEAAIFSTASGSGGPSVLDFIEE